MISDVMNCINENAIVNQHVLALDTLKNRKFLSARTHFNLKVGLHLHKWAA